MSAERRGTFKANYYGTQYLYRYTVSRDWALFAKKSVFRVLNVVASARLDNPDRPKKIALATQLTCAFYFSVDSGHNCRLVSGSWGSQGQPCRAVDMLRKAALDPTAT